MRRLLTTVLSVPLLVGAVVALGVAPAGAEPGATSAVFVNEVHYDNASTDVGEFVEVAGPAGTDLTGWTVVLYNGNGGGAYATLPLDTTLVDAGEGYGFTSVDAPGLQNGSPDGLALVDGSGAVVQFLSYEGVFTAADGPAASVESTDIGVSESGSTPVGQSLQLTGTGTTAGDFGWLAPAVATRDAANTGQSFGDAPVNVFLNELHYDNDGGDVGEFVEVAGTAGTDLTGWSVVLYNGNGGAAYDTIDLGGTLADAGDGAGFASFPAPGLQNGSPDGLALVDPTGAVVEFLSYEGVFTAADGPAAGAESTDIGVSESGSTPPGQSLQLTGTGTTAADFAWAGPEAETPGAVNVGQSFGDGGPGGPGDVTIMEIQGTGDVSPLVDQEVTTTGVVTRLAGNGFYFQDPTGDGDAATSDGIFAFTPTGVAVGDAVEVSGTVTEFFEATQISATTVTVTGTGTVAATPIDLETLGGAFEPFEHMLVATGTLVAGDVFNYLQFGEITAYPFLPLQPTEVVEPGPGAAQLAAEIGAAAIIVEDGVGGRNNPTFPFLVDDGGVERLVKWGDELPGGEGIITFTFGNYKLLPTADPFTTGATFQPTNPRPTTTPDPGGSITAASFNALNLWTNDGGQERGARTQEQYDIQLAKLVDAVTALDADVIALQELQNDPAGDAATAVDFNVGLEPAEALADAVNASLGVDRYDWIDTGVIGTDAIKVGFIYDRTAVSPVGDPIIVGEDDPTYQPDRNRPSVVQGFEEIATGERFTAVSVHFKSKSGSELDDADTPEGVCVDDDPSNDVPDCDQGDGAGFFNPARTAAAEVLAAFLADPANLPDPDVLVLGDFNAYTQEDPVDVFVEDNGYTNLGDLSAEGVSFVFFGLGGNLDHAVGNGPLTAQVTGAEIYDINGTESGNYVYFEDDFPGQLPILDRFRSSDHSPVIVGLALDSGPDPVVFDCGSVSFSEADLLADGFDIIVGTDGRDVLRGTNGNDFLFSGGGRDVVDGRGGDDIICTGDGRDLARGGDGDDEIYLGGGRDVALAGNGDDLVDGGDDRDVAVGGRGFDTAVDVELALRFEA